MAIRKKWGVILGGGTARGAVQPPILRALIDELGGPPAGVAGVSVGAVNGSLIAEGRIDDLDAEWATIDGVRSFASRTIPGLDIMRSLKPTRKRLEQRAAGARLLCPTWVGLVDIAAEVYQSIALHTLPDLRDRWDAIIGSARQPLLMVEETFKGRPVMDGGAGGHVLPPLPNWSEMDEIHIIACAPFGGARRTPSTVDSAKGPRAAMECAIDLWMSRQADEDLEDLRDQYAAAVPTYLYAPRAWDEVGRAFDAKRVYIEARYETGRRMYRNRERLARIGPIRRPR